MSKYSTSYSIGENIKKAFENITDDQLKRLISYISNDIEPNIITIKELNTKVYYHSNNTKSYITEDDIYANGLILDNDKGKVLKDFTVGIIIKRDRENFKVVGIDLLLNGKNQEEINDIKRNLLPMYLTPSFFNFLI